MFHGQHPDVALELRVTRRPYSFRGGEPAETGTWRWRKGLSAYVGDQVHSQLIGSGLVAPAQAALLHTDPKRAFADPQIVGALRAIARHTGRSMIEDPAEIAEIVRAHERGDDFGWARGRQISAFDHFAGARATAALRQLGDTCGIRFRFDVAFGWHPIESQRALIWAAQYGKQEDLVDAIARRHFEEAQSVHDPSTLLDAAREIGLSADELSAFLASEAGTQQVWQSYRDTVGKHAIHSIPYFVFNGPATNGGPFRDGSSLCHTVNGSASPADFLAIFESILAEARPPPTRELGRRAAAPPTAAAAAVKASAGSMKAGFMKATQPAPKQPSAATIPAAAAALIGVRVAVHGLKSKPELNGRHGVCERVDSATGRCVVRLDRVEAPMLIKPSNLRCASEATPLAAQPASTRGAGNHDGGGDDDDDDDDDALAMYGF